MSAHKNNSGPLYSMTGYGEVLVPWQDKTLSLQVLSLNSRTFDLHFTIPPLFNGQVLEWRRTLQEKLQRGRIHLTIAMKDEEQNFIGKNMPLVKSYFHDLKGLVNELGADTDPLHWALQLLVQESATTSLKASPKDMPALKRAFQEVVEHCVASRFQEGVQLKEHLVSCIKELTKVIEELLAYLPQRKKVLQEKLIEKKQLFESAQDATSWEKEFTQYADKINLEEEGVRLQSHLRYLSMTLDKGHPIGKAIGFILQEMLREVNTVGAKAQDAKLQRMAIVIKDLLEQIKEQAQNVL